MKVEGRHVLPHDREVVWEALMNPALLSRTLPGCEALEPDGENAWKGTLRVQVGPVRGVFKGRLELADLDRPDGYRMRLRGQGPTGFMDGEGTISLEDEAEDSTDLCYDLEFQVGGRIAGVGQRVLDSSARAIARQGLEGLEREMASRSAGAGDSSGLPAPHGDDRPEPRARTGGPTQAELAARIARDVAADLVPPKSRPWIVAGLLALLALLAAVLWPS